MSSASFVDDVISRLNADLANDPDTAAFRFLVRDDMFGVVFRSYFQEVEEASPTWAAERSSEERLEGIADKVQDEVLEWLHGPTWPKCPSHRHPPRATLIDDVAMWQCPADESVCWRIGGPA